MPPKTIRTASEAERRRLVFEVYSLLQKLFPRVGYSALHQAIHALQPRMKEAYGVDLGYRFDARNFYGPWDRRLQEDIDILDARGVVDNHDEPSSGLLTHRLAPTMLGEKNAELDARLDKKAYLFGTSRAELRKTLNRELERWK